jgi:hypothetical protein
MQILALMSLHLPSPCHKEVLLVLVLLILHLEEVVNCVCKL